MASDCHSSGLVTVFQAMPGNYRAKGARRTPCTRRDLPIHDVAQCTRLGCPSTPNTASMNPGANQPDGAECFRACDLDEIVEVGARMTGLRCPTHGLPPQSRPFAPKTTSREVSSSQLRFGRSGSERAYGPGDVRPAIGAITTCRSRRRVRSWRPVRGRRWRRSPRPCHRRW